MSMFSLTCYIKTPTTGIRNAVKRLIPDEADPRVWAVGYYSREINDPDDGVRIFLCDARFSLESDRNGVENSILQGVGGIIHACDPGSFVIGYKTWLDEAEHGNPPQKAEAQTVLRKLWL